MIKLALEIMGILAMLGAFLTQFWVVPRIRNSHQWHVLGLCLFALFFFGLGREMWLRSAGQMTTAQEYIITNSTGVISLWVVLTMFWAKIMFKNVR